MFLLPIELMHTHQRPRILTRVEWNGCQVLQWRSKNSPLCLELNTLLIFPDSILVQQHKRLELHQRVSGEYPIGQCEKDTVVQTYQPRIFLALSKSFFNSSRVKFATGTLYDFKISKKATLPRPASSAARPEDKRPISYSFAAKSIRASCANSSGVSFSAFRMLAGHSICIFTDDILGLQRAARQVTSENIGEGQRRCQQSSEAGTEHLKVAVAAAPFPPRSSRRTPHRPDHCPA